MMTANRIGPELEECGPNLSGIGPKMEPELEPNGVKNEPRIDSKLDPDWS